MLALNEPGLYIVERIRRILAYCDEASVVSTMFLSSSHFLCTALHNDTTRFAYKSITCMKKVERYLSSLMPPYVRSDTFSRPLGLITLERRSSIDSWSDDIAEHDLLCSGTHSLVGVFCLSSWPSSWSSSSSPSSNLPV